LNAKSREKNKIKDIVDFSARLLLVTNTFLSGGKNKKKDTETAHKTRIWVKHYSNTASDDAQLNE